jgi:(p)ppGpp synthase/HD superfamily hydrolase
MATLKRAIAIAAEAHEGMVDKAGAPYILHPLRVMMRMETIQKMIAAVLHDVVEDSEPWTLQRLKEEGFDQDIIDVYSKICDINYRRCDGLESTDAWRKYPGTSGKSCG